MDFADRDELAGELTALLGVDDTLRRRGHVTTRRG
jgi:hypothetical protein